MSLNIQNKVYQDVLFINYEIYLPPQCNNICLKAGQKRQYTFNITKYVNLLSCLKIIRDNTLLNATL